MPDLQLMPDHVRNVASRRPTAANVDRLMCVLRAAAPDERLTVRELAERMQLPPAKEASDGALRNLIVHAIRHYNHCILATCKQPAGYWLARTEEEVQAAIAELEQRKRGLRHHQLDLTRAWNAPVGVTARVRVGRSVVQTIISGGQTGADMGGLLAGRDLGLRTTGWAPHGWQTERGANEVKLRALGLKEHTGGYRERTRANIVAASATVVFGNLESPGSRLTIEECRRLRKPLARVPWVPGKALDTSTRFAAWLIEHQVAILNVAGNRESRAAGIEQAVRDYLVEAIGLTLTALP